MSKNISDFKEKFVLLSKSIDVRPSETSTIFLGNPRESGVKQISDVYFTPGQLEYFFYLLTK